MYRLDGVLGETIRLVQPTSAATISILFENGSLVVDAEPTHMFASLPVRYYDFTPSQIGGYLIYWHGADPAQRWELIDIRANSLAALIKAVKTKTDYLPSAETG